MMKLHIWTDEVSYLAVCHADTVAEARELLAVEVGGNDGSCPERVKAWKDITENTSAPYNGRVAAFCLSDSAEVREQIAHSEKISAERDALRAKLVAAEEQLEFDRTTCHNFLRALDQALDGRFWLTEGRGSYAWDDDRYREEFRDAAIALRSILDPMQKMAQNLANRLPTTEAVMKARVDLKARAEAAEAQVTELQVHAERLREALEAARDEHRKWAKYTGQIDSRTYGLLCAAIAETSPQSLAMVRAEAQAEALDDIAKDAGIDGEKAYMATVIYREFPDVLTTKIGVVKAADLMQRAAQIRKEAEGGN